MTTEELARQLAEAVEQKTYNEWGLPNFDEGYRKNLLALHAGRMLPILSPHIERLEKLEAAARSAIGYLETSTIRSDREAAEMLREALKGADHASD